MESRHPLRQSENYLKNIYQAQLSLPHDGLVSWADWSAGALGVVPEVTTMVKALRRSRLATLRAVPGVRLTVAGQKLARVRFYAGIGSSSCITRARHGHGMTEIHDEAENLEHAVSDGVIARMDDMLATVR